MSESVILCEGYDDRAFWKGWLKHLGCADLWEQRETPQSPVKDPWKRDVRKGHHAYTSNSERFVRVVPCIGRPNVLPTARRYLLARKTKRLERLVVNVDLDVAANGSEDSATGLRLEDVLRITREFDESAAENNDGDILLDKGDTVVSLVRWEVEDESGAGIPDTQTLERVVCAAMIAAHPDRNDVVQRWLESRPNPPDDTPKQYAWSYMAGWYADAGCERFYSSLWEDEAVAGELETRLRETGAWRVAAALAE